jgi:cytoskeletal protein CcmA (bactofilin family)
MALFGREEKDPRSGSPATPEPPPARPVPPSSPPPMPLRETHPMTLEKEKVGDGEFAEVNAYLGRGSRVSGKLNFDGTVRVDGHVEGEISAQDTLIVGERAVVTATISGTTVVIKGKVTGDINAKKRVEIRAPGKLYGNIVTPSLVIHEGVIFEGQCSMGGAEGLKEEKGGDGVLSRAPSHAAR